MPINFLWTFLQTDISNQVDEPASQEDLSLFPLIQDSALGFSPSERSKLEEG